MSSGIYKITNTQNGKVYIGSSSNIQKRFLEHKSALKSHTHHSYKLQKDFDDCNDINVFKFEILEEMDTDKIDLFSREQFYIDKYDAFNNGYNCCEYSANPKYFGFKRTNILSKDTGLVNYIKIPKEIIYEKDIGDKRVLIFSYLCSMRALDDTVAFSIAELCKWSDVKPNQHQGKINEKYTTMLYSLSNLGYIHEHLNKDTLPYHDQYNYHIINLNTRKFDIPDKYGIIYFDELQKIINFKRELKDKDITLDRMSAAYILLVLSYIRANLYRGNDNPKCCYRYYQKISEDIGISERYIGRVVEILDLLHIIKSQECPRIRYSKSDNEFGFCTNVKIFANYRQFKKNGANTFIDENYDCNLEIKKQIELLEKTVT